MTLFQKIGIQSGQHILDIGFRDIVELCAIAEIIGEQGQVIGIDASPKAVHKATQELTENGRTNIQVQEGSILSIPAPDNTFDVVLCKGVIHEVRKLEPAFLEMVRVCKPGGVIAVVDFTPISLWRFALYFAKATIRMKSLCPDIHPGFSYGHLKKLLANTGLTELHYEVMDAQWSLGKITVHPFLLKIQPGQS